MRIDVLFCGSRLELDGEDHMVGVSQDIRERKRFEEELERHALYDSLTGLPNRSLFRDHITRALDRAGRNGSHVALLFVDLNRFKAVNDSLGHAAGDRVLRTLGRHLQEAVRTADTVARFGSDEFGVLLEEVRGTEDIEQMAARVRSVFEKPFRVGETECPLTASIGAAEALVRWDHPERGLVAPGAFIPLAEETGLILPLGEAVLEMALSAGRDWREAGLVNGSDFRISVNLSAHQYQEEDLVERVRGKVRAAGLPLSVLTLEITETVIVTGGGRLQELRDEGASPQPSSTSSRDRPPR